MKRLPYLHALGGALVALGLNVAGASPAEAVLRSPELRWIPQGDLVADGYEIHVRSDGLEWDSVDIGFVEDQDGTVSFVMPLHDDRDHELAVSAYVWDGNARLSSLGSNVLEVAAVLEAECLEDLDCSDGNACTGTERCVFGVCEVGSALECADPGPCQAAVCDIEFGCLVVDDPTTPRASPSRSPSRNPTLSPNRHPSRSCSPSPNSSRVTARRPT